MQLWYAWRYKYVSFDFINGSLTLNLCMMKHLNSTFAALGSLLLLLFVSIITVLSSFSPPGEPENFSPPVLKSSRQKSSLCLSPQYMMNAWYQVECVTAFCAEFDPDLERKDKMSYHEFYEDPSDKKPLAYSNESIRLIVDTLQEITMTKRPIWARYLFHHNLGGAKTVLQDDTLIQDVKSFPVFVANTSKTKIANIETQDGSLMMTVEAQDGNKQWKALEYWSHSWCGNSYYSLDIPPQHFAFTRGVKCSGDFYTTCRLKLRFGKDSLYSNEFRMSINKSQFNKPVPDNKR